MDASIGEIRAFAFNWTPYGWVACDGSTYQVQQFQALYAVLGNTYGGTAGQTFKVPNLQGRVMVGTGANNQTGTQYSLAQVGGVESVAITPATAPAHTHNFNAGTTLTAKTLTAETKVAGSGTSFLSNLVEHVSATTNRLGQSYIPNAPDSALSPSAITPFVGGGAPHENRQPYLTINYCINWDGNFPPRP